MNIIAVLLRFRVHLLVLCFAVSSCQTYSSLYSVTASDNDTFDEKYSRAMKDESKTSPLYNVYEFYDVSEDSAERTRDEYLETYRAKRRMYYNNISYFLELERAKAFGDDNAVRYYTETLPADNIGYIRRNINDPRRDIANIELNEIKTVFHKLYERRKSKLLQTIDDPISDYRVLDYFEDVHVRESRVAVQGHEF